VGILARRVPSIGKGIGVIGALGGIVAISLLPHGFVFPIGFLLLMIVAWTYARPMRALSVVILGDLILLLGGSTEITLVEVVYGVYSFGYLGFWLWQKVFVTREPVLEHTADTFLVAFFVVATCTLPITVLGGQTALWWFRELVTLAQLLLFFPLRDAMRDRRGMIALVVALLLMFTIVAVNNLMNYRAVTAAAAFLWELTASRQAFGDHYFFPALVVLVSAWIHVENRTQAWLLLPLIVMMALALALTFSRGFWVSAALALLVLFVLARGRERRRLTLATVLGGAAGLFAMGIFLGKAGSSVLTALFNRVVSVRGAMVDLSFMNRVVESQAAVDGILKNPILGHGVGSVLSRYNILDHETTTNLYIHNGYLYLIYKVGIVGTIPYLAFLAVVIWTGLRLSFDRSCDRTVQAFTRAFTAILSAMLVVNVTSNVFVQKQSILVLAFGCACLMGTYAAQKRVQEQEGVNGQ